MPAFYPERCLNLAAIAPTGSIVGTDVRHVDDLAFYAVDFDNCWVSTHERSDGCSADLLRRKWGGLRNRVCVLQKEERSCE
jgi:hypothetical protein